MVRAGAVPAAHSSCSADRNAMCVDAWTVRAVTICDGRQPQGEAFLTHAQVNSAIAGLAGTPLPPALVSFRAGQDTSEKIAWSSAVLSPTLKASFVLMCSPLGSLG